MTRPLRWLTYFLIFVFALGTLAYTAGQLYKPRLLAKINDLINENVNGEFSLGDLDFTFFEQFPAFSIKLSDVYLRGPRYATYHHEFFSARKISIHIKLGHLLMGEVDFKSIGIDQGNIFIFRTRDGYTNLDIFKKKQQTAAPGPKGKSLLTIALEKIEFRNTRVQYIDSVKRKSYGAAFTDTITRIEPTDSSQQISLQGDMTFLGLMMNADKGSYLLDKRVRADLQLEVLPAGRGLIVNPSILQFEQSMVGLRGRFNFAAPSNFRLRINSQNLHFAEGLTMVTKALSDKLNKFSFDKPLTLQVDLDGSLSGGEPKIDMVFSASNTQVTAGKMVIDDLSMKGTFVNHTDSMKENGDPNTTIALQELEASVHGIPSKGTVRIVNLKDPQATLHLKSEVSLPSLNQEGDTTRIRFNAGTYQSEVNFDGRLSEYLNDTTTTFTAKLNGEMHVKDGSFTMPSMDKTFSGINADIAFTEQQMTISKLNVSVNGNPVEITSQVSGFVPFFFQPKQKGLVKLSVFSSGIDLATLGKKQKPKKRHTGGRKRVTDLLDMLYAKVEFDINVKLNELRNGPFVAGNVQARFLHLRDRFDMKGAKLNLAGGEMQMDLSMKNLDQEISDFLLTAHVKNADAGKLLKAFNNFGQKAIRSENLDGTISLDVRLAAKINDQYKLIMPSMDGNVSLKIRDGNIVNCEPLMNMTNFLMKNRDFANVKFAEINSHFRITGPSVDIERMQIQSNILSLFIEGRYSLENETDLSIQIPLSNLKKRDKDFKPENVSPDAKLGPSVFLRARTDKEGKIGIAYDPFKKFHKKKKVAA